MSKSSEEVQNENNNRQSEIEVDLPPAEPNLSTEDDPVSLRSTCLKSMMIAFAGSGFSGLALFTGSCILNYLLTPPPGEERSDQLSSDIFFGVETGLALAGVSILGFTSVAGIAFFTRPKPSERQALISDKQVAIPRNN